MKTYVPKPIDLSDVNLNEELCELREAIAKNAHDVWAKERLAQGWSYGPQRDDAKKETPCMVEYSELPDSEKRFDREVAMNTLKLVVKLGYDIVKRENTPLCEELLCKDDEPIQVFCPQCPSKGINTPVTRHDIFCAICGEKLDIDWSVFKKKK